MHSLLRRRRIVLGSLTNHILQTLLAELALEYLLLDGAGCHETVHEYALFLPITPDTAGSLLVIRWIPVRIE